MHVYIYAIFAKKHCIHGALKWFGIWISFPTFTSTQKAKNIVYLVNWASKPDIRLQDVFMRVKSMANWQPFAAQNVSLGTNNGLPNSSDWIFIVDSMINQWYDRHNTSTVILLLPYLFSYSGQLQNDKHPSHNYSHMSPCHSLPQNTNHCHYHHKILPLCTSHPCKWPKPHSVEENTTAWGSPPTLLPALSDPIIYPTQDCECMIRVNYPAPYTVSPTSIMVLTFPLK